MKDFLFPQPTDSKGFSLLLLCLRLFFGVMFLVFYLTFNVVGPFFQDLLQSGIN